MLVQDLAIAAFERFIKNENFPCVGAKSAAATLGMTFFVAASLVGPGDVTALLAALQEFAVASHPKLASFVVLFPATPPLDERAFENALWQNLAALEAADRLLFAPDPAVSADPESPDFAISIGGAGFFVVGMHPGASRRARRSPLAALAFNRHDQFRALKSAGRYERMRAVVRHRDIALQGDINPMLADHGQQSEASQYSGRDVTSEWECPFKPGRHAA